MVCQIVYFCFFVFLYIHKKINCVTVIVAAFKKLDSVHLYSANVHQEEEIFGRIGLRMRQPSASTGRKCWKIQL